MVTVMQRGSFCLISASDGTVTSAEVTMTQQAETSSPPSPYSKQSYQYGQADFTYLNPYSFGCDVIQF